ncbi:MAG: DUF3710 domain-containing protein, partial [Angustibacter sp.]
EVTESTEEPDAPRSTTFDRSGGPFDVAEVEELEGRLDIGALLVPLVPGLELQLQVDEETQSVTGAFIVLADSGVQLQAFAAPRTSGIWAEVSEEIAAGITEQGGTVDPGYGRFGRELLARVPAQLPDGRTEFQPLRFAGVDGPRWLLRAVFHGRAAMDPEGAPELVDLVANLVVSRGPDPMAPRELLPLRLPQGAQVAEEPPPAEPVDDLQPFARGPEITERR